MIIYFDTETTGLTPGRIIQLTYIIEERNKDLRAKNFFFTVDYIPPETTKIHGFTAERIKELAKGKAFSDFSEEIYEDFKNASLIIAHNIEFDIAFLNAELYYNNLSLHINEKFCAMQYFTPIIKIPRKTGGYKRVKLTEVQEFLDIYLYDVSKILLKLFNSIDFKDHDARYDTALLYLTVLVGRNKYGDLMEFINKYL